MHFNKAVNLSLNVWPYLWVELISKVTALSDEGFGATSSVVEPQQFGIEPWWFYMELQRLEWDLFIYNILVLYRMGGCLLVSWEM